MTGTIFDINRFAVHDGDGIRTTVFFKGCPLRCVWCHNPEGLAEMPQLAFYAHKCTNCGLCAANCPSGAHKITDGVHRFDRTACLACGKCETLCINGALKLYGQTVTVEKLLPVLIQDKAFYDNSGGGVTLSGGECLLQASFCGELLKALKQNGIHTAVDTCGDVPREAINAVLAYTDIFLYDIKALDERLHLRCTGHSNRQILENLHYLADKNVPVEIRYPFVPGYNDGEAEEIAAFLAQFSNITKVRMLPYHNYAGSKYAALGLENKSPAVLPEETALKAARACFSKRDIKVG